jgi:hypothetical protein
VFQAGSRDALESKIDNNRVRGWQELVPGLLSSLRAMFFRLAVSDEASYGVTDFLAAADGRIQPGHRSDPKAACSNGLDSGAA